MPSPSEHDSRFILSSEQAQSLASQFGTPLYVVDEKHFRARIREWLDSARSAYERTELAFASKANSTLALLAIACHEGCLIDVASEGEFRAALAAGVPPHRCHLHGSNKQRAEIEFAIDQGIGQIVVDSRHEIEMIAQIRDARRAARQAESSEPLDALPLGRICPDLMLRLAPGVDPVTHEKISTGQADTKFGFNIQDGSAERALMLCMGLGLPIVGFHCHVGSQLLDPEAQRAGGEQLAKFAARMKVDRGYEAHVINVGGGLGVRYTDADVPMPILEYTELVTKSVLAALENSGLYSDEYGPILVHEPGRSLVAESCVSLYRIGVIKSVSSPKKGERTYASVDGGLSDNPRPALYGSKYTVLLAGRESDRPNIPYTVSGKHCETDTLFEDVPLPIDLEEGDLLQVLCTGAYNSSMASNYNRYQRPATVLVREDGGFELIQRRDSWDEMIARELIPSHLLKERDAVAMFEEGPRGGF